MSRPSTCSGSIRADTGDYATKGFLVAKNEEAYANVFTVHYPDEEREAGRPLRTAPCYERMRDLGAVFGQRFGWERPNWFAPEQGIAAGGPLVVPAFEMV